MNKLSFITSYIEAWYNKEQEVRFDLSIVKDGTTTIIYGQMIEDYFGKTSVAGCAILSPEDTYNEVTGIKIAFKNLLRSSPLYEDEARQVYSYFRKILYMLPANDLKLEFSLDLASLKV